MLMKEKKIDKLSLTQVLFFFLVVFASGVRKAACWAIKAYALHSTFNLSEFSKSENQKSFREVGSTD